MSACEAPCNSGFERCFINKVSYYCIIIVEGPPRPSFPPQSHASAWSWNKSTFLGSLNLPLTFCYFCRGSTNCYPYFHHAGCGVCCSYLHKAEKRFAYWKQRFKHKVCIKVIEVNDSETILIMCLSCTGFNTGQGTVLAFSRRSSYINAGFTSLSAPPDNGDLLEEVLSESKLCCHL